MINTLISKKSCKVAPVPGETKIWQYVTLFKRISLIDCPGVVVDTAGDTETDSVLKGVVRAERLENPEDYIDSIQERVKREHIAAQYKLPKDKQKWENSLELMETISRQYGRLRKGGDPCIRSAAVMLINDYQRGRLPHYVPPPDLKDDKAEDSERSDREIAVQQDLDKIGEENMHEGGQDDEEEKDKKLAPAEEEDGDDKVAEMEQEDAGRGQASSELIADGEWED